MTDMPVSLPFDVVEYIAPLARAVAKANAAIESPHYFHLEVRAPGDGVVAHIDGDFPDEMFRFAWDPSQQEKR